MKIAFAGSFAVRLAEPVRARLSIPCEVIADDETKIVAQLADTDILVSMGFTQEMATAGPLLRLVQVPGAGWIGSIAMRSGHTPVWPMPTVTRRESPSTSSGR